jgi:hypothetical protein
MVIRSYNTVPGQGFQVPMALRSYLGFPAGLSKLFERSVVSICGFAAEFLRVNITSHSNQILQAPMASTLLGVPAGFRPGAGDGTRHALRVSGWKAGVIPATPGSQQDNLSMLPSDSNRSARPTNRPCTLFIGQLIGTQPRGWDKS